MTLLADFKNILLKKFRIKNVEQAYIHLTFLFRNCFSNGTSLDFDSHVIKRPVYSMVKCFVS